jgi:hypothetical protein
MLDVPLGMFQQPATGGSIAQDNYGKKCFAPSHLLAKKERNALGS